MAKGNAIELHADKCTALGAWSDNFVAFCRLFPVSVSWLEINELRVDKENVL